MRRLHGTADHHAARATPASALRRLRAACAADRAQDGREVSLGDRVADWMRLRGPAGVVARWAAAARTLYFLKAKAAALRRTIVRRRCARALGLWRALRACSARRWGAARWGDRRRRLAVIAAWQPQAQAYRATRLAIVRLRRKVRAWARLAALARWQEHHAHRTKVVASVAWRHQRRRAEAVARLAAHARYTRAIEAWGRTVPSLSEEVASARKAAKRRTPATPPVARAA